MEKELYSMIFKRKSFHIFRDIGNINPDELQSIEEKYNNLTPLINGIQTAIGDIVRFAPSACNTQPWKVTAEEKCLTVYRYKKLGKRGIMPADKVVHYNRIDIGIFLCFLELCMMQSDVFYERELFTDTAESDCEEVLTAKYRLN